MAEAETIRRFMFAPDLEKLGEKVQAAREAADKAEELYQQIEDADDTLERLCWVVAACREVARGDKTLDQLQDECDKAMFGLQSEIPDTAAMATRRP